MKKLIKTRNKLARVMRLLRDNKNVKAYTILEKMKKDLE